MSGSSGCDLTAYPEYKFEGESDHLEVFHHAEKSRWYKVSCRSDPTLEKTVSLIRCTYEGKFTPDLKVALLCPTEIGKSSFNVFIYVVARVIENVPFRLFQSNAHQQKKILN